MTQNAVTYQEIEPGIAQITMQDRINKNTFSKEIIFGLKDSFKRIEQDHNIKVVILTGYDNYFSSGGTKTELLALHRGEIKFTDIDIYRLALDCTVPVIAAMQGQAMGGGFAMGLFSDFVILSRESIYSTNFMVYGFTPGMGATYILPQKIGIVLAQELLLSAKNYRGEELQKRGIPFQVYPKSEVLGEAINLARELTNKPRHSLIMLKNHLVKKMREDLPNIIEAEQTMHGLTIHQPEVIERIESLFYSS
ncbi:MAG: enoyl-CoA hydratase/isomerase family protein [Legionella sp.]|nr:enoyl-CoA hydratase/isomerase family protein [Legionella sp.]